MAATHVRTAGDAEELAARLRSTERTRPLCLVSTPPGVPDPAIDVEALAEGCGDLADVVVIETGAASARLAELLPPRCAVWGGAGRVYPVDPGWLADPLRSPLRFVYHGAEAARAGDRLLEDALRMSAGPAANRRPAVRTRRVGGVIHRIVSGGSRAFVLLDDGALATVSADLVLPGIPLDWYVREGMRIEAESDGSRGPLRLGVLAADDRGVLEHFGAGTVTSALVRDAGRQEATLLLHPAVPVPVRRVDVSSNPRDLVDHLLGAGEVVAVRVVRDPQGRLRLRLDDLEDDEVPRDALPLVAGGPPWLKEGRDLVTARVEEEAEAAAEPHPVPPLALEPAEPEAPSRPVPGPGRRTPPPPPVPAPTASRSGSLHQALLTIETLKGEVRQLRAAAEQPAGRRADSASDLELAEARARVGDLQRRLGESQRFAADLRKRARDAASGGRPGPLGDRDRFDDDAHWIQHEVLLAWIDRLGPAERRRHPVDHGWTVGPRFAASLRDLTDPQLRKAFRTIVDVVVGLDAELAGRDLHRLRTGLGGDDPAETRAADGATCWRVAIERNVPAALRLHYWRGRDGVELSRVVPHDDFRP